MSDEPDSQNTKGDAPGTPSEPSASEPAPLSTPRKKRRWWRWLLVAALVLFALRACVPKQSRTLRGPEDAHLLIFPPPAYTHSAPGRLIVYASNLSFPGDKVSIEKPLHSDALGRDRNLVVYVPDAVDAAKKDAPLIVIFHGYLDTPAHMVPATLPALAAAMDSGALPPCVLAWPDLTIGGNGADDPSTPLDERLGTWGVDSNLGRFETQLADELIPWLRANLPVRKDAAGTVLLGYSVGGNVAARLGVAHRELADTVVGIGAALDLRYSIDGGRLRPYDPAKYHAIEDDKPDRPILFARQLGIFTDRWAFWPVFDSDHAPGPVWAEDRPVWERLRDASPTDLAAREGLNLTGQVYDLVAGDHDVYSFQNHIPMFAERVRARGAVVQPAVNVVPGAHSLNFVTRQLPEIARRLGERLREHAD